MIKDLQKLSALLAQAMDRLRESKEIADEYEKKMKDAKRDDLKDPKIRQSGEGFHQRYYGLYCWKRR